MRSTDVNPFAAQLIEAWRINNRINLFLIDRIDDDGWRSTMSSRGGRDVARQFAHLHDVRLSWLEISARDLGSGLKKFGAKATVSKAAVTAALEASGAAIERLVERGVENGGVLKGFTRGVGPALAYLIAHDAHHRGSVLLTLKLSGHKVDTATQYGIWEWEKR